MATEYSVSVLLRLVDKLSNPLGKLSDKMRNFSEKLNQVGQKMQAAGKKMSLLVTTPLVLMGKAALQTAGEFEKNQIALESMLGSAEKAKVLLKDLVEFAATTPFQLPGLIEGSKQLLAFGIPAEDIIQKLRNLGNVAQGNQGKLTGLVQAFGKIRAKGVASMRELNMMINSGVPIMRALSEEFGVAESEIFEMSRTGQLTFDRIDKAITNLTTGTGMFAGILEKQSQSLLGLWSTLLDNLSLLGKEIAETFMPMLKGLINGIMGIVKWFRDLSAGTKHLIGILVGLTAAIGPLLFIAGKLFVLIATGMGPIGLIVAGFVALSAVIIGVSAAIDKHNKRYIDSANKMKDHRKEVNKLVDEYKELEQKTDRNIEEEKRMAELQKILRKEIGDTAFEIDKMTGSVKLNSEAFSEWNKEQRLMEAAQRRERAQEIIKQLYEDIGPELDTLTAMLEVMKKRGMTEAELRRQSEFTKKQRLLLRAETLNEELRELQDEIAILEGRKKEVEKEKPDEPPIDTDDIDEVNEGLKTMVDLLDEIDRATKQRLVAQLLKGKTERAFRTIDLLNLYAAEQRKAGVNIISSIEKKSVERKEVDTKSKVEVSVKVEAEEGTAAKISKIKKTGEEDVSVDVESYIGMHQYAI